MPETKKKKHKVLFPQPIKFWRFFFPVVCADHICGSGWYFRAADYCSAISSLSLRYINLMHLQRRPCLGLNNALLGCWCPFTRARQHLCQSNMLFWLCRFHCCYGCTGKGGGGCMLDWKLGGAGDKKGDLPVPQVLQWSVSETVESFSCDPPCWRGSLSPLSTGLCFIFPFLAPAHRASFSF